MWAADHDRWAPDFVSCCVAELEREPSAVLCYPQVRMVDHEGRGFEWAYNHVDTRGMSRVKRFNLTLWGMVGASAIYGMFRASALRMTHLYQPVIGPDNVLLAEASLLGSFVHVPRPMFTMVEQPWGGRRLSPRETHRRQLQGMRLKRVGMRLYYRRLAMFLAIARGVAHAPVGLAAKPPLFACVALAYVGVLYKYVPGFLRRPLRAWLRSRWKVSEGRE